MSMSIHPADEDLAWAREELTARLNTLAGPLSGRNDVLLRVLWDLPEGTPPGWWDRATALMSINGDVALGGAEPADVDPTTRAGRLRHPVVIGLASHEGAHARVTRWQFTITDDVPDLVLRVAALLEDPRAEGRQLTYRPGDRVYLRAAARELIKLPDASAGDAGADPDEERWRAATAIILIYGRAAAGVLSKARARKVLRVARDVLGPDTVDQLQALVEEAISLADGDGPGLVDVARRWLDILGVPESGTSGALPSAGCCGEAVGAGCSPRPAEGSRPDPIGEAVAGIIAEVAEDAAESAAAAAREEEALPARDRATLAARAAEKTARAEAASAATAVFTVHHGRGASPTGPVVTGSRTPTAAERAAAAKLAAALRRASYRAPERTRLASAVPPGRLIGRAAKTAAAQRELGHTVTARPYRVTRRRRVEQPKARVGIAGDVSGSMGALAGPVASAVWILATANAQVGGTTAAVAFGEDVTPLAEPGRPLLQVPVFAAHDGEEAFTRAVLALDGTLGLSSGTGARLLVVISDGEFVIPGEPEAGARLIQRLTRSGAGVLWLDHDGRARVMPGAVRVPLEAVTDTAAVIGSAVEKALAAAR